MASINNERTTEELITEALRLDSEDHPYWDIVSVLHHSPTTDTLLQARQLCFSQLPSERELGVNVLAQLGSGNDAFHEERLQTLLSLLDTEEESRVLSAITFALGHLHDERVVLPLLRFKDHPSQEVRYGVVFGLSGQRVDEAIAALIELSADVDSDVRDWATFELGTILDDIDTPQLRDALFARIDDPDGDTRAEALVGLARRKDERILRPLIMWFEQLGATAGNLLYEAAIELADPRLCQVLLEIKGKGVDDKDLEDALTSCRCTTQDSENE